MEDGKTIKGSTTRSFQYLCIYLIQKYYGSEFAIYTTKMFWIEKGKSSQLTNSIFQTQKNHKDIEIHENKGFIEENAAEIFVVFSG